MAHTQIAPRVLYYCIFILLFLPPFPALHCSHILSVTCISLPPLFAVVPSNQPFVFPSADESLLAGTVLFSAGSVSATYDLVIQDDDVALENGEVFTLSLGGPSDPRAQIGGTVGGVVYYDTTTVTILDNDSECIIQCVFYMC